MADRRRLVTLDALGAATTVLDLEDSVNYFASRGSFQVRPGAVQPVMAQRQRRFGGATTAAEGHANGSIVFRTLVKGASADTALVNLEALRAQLSAPRQDLYIEWRPDGATFSTFYQVRGSATVGPEYNWGSYKASILFADVEIPVAPICRSTPSSITIASTALPATIALSPAIPGSAPALVDIGLSGPASGNPAIWAMFAWTPRPTAPLGSTVVPFGIIEAESMTKVTFATVANAAYRGGNAALATTSGFGLGSLSAQLDPTTMVPDDFAQDTIEIEVWARVVVASTVVNPALAITIGGSLFGAQYDPIYGASGKLIPVPTSGTVQRTVRLGTLTMSTKRLPTLGWTFTVNGGWSTGSSGTFGVDYIMLVPARSRALGTTGKDPSQVAAFLPAVSTSKVIYGNDLSGEAYNGTGISATTVMARAPGLGGSPIEMAPGNNDLFLKLSSMVPDAPTATATSEDLSHTCTGFVRITPRYYIARGV